jgi:hypothetical protein
MTNQRQILCWLAIVLATGPAVVTAHYAYQGFPLYIAQRGHSDNGATSLDQAVSRARRQTKGQVLSAETIRVDGRKIHRIKVLTTNGRVKRINIDAIPGKHNNNSGKRNNKSGKRNKQRH